MSTVAWLHGLWTSVILCIPLKPKILIFSASRLLFDAVYSHMKKIQSSICLQCFRLDFHSCFFVYVILSIFEPLKLLKDSSLLRDFCFSCFNTQSFTTQTKRLLKGKCFARIQVVKVSFEEHLRKNVQNRKKGGSWPKA